MLNLFGDFVPMTAKEIIESAAKEFGIEAPKKALLSFSGGSDSRTLAHIARPIMHELGIGLELAAIRTGLAMDCWEQSVLEFADWVGLPVSFWTGEGRMFYQKFVEGYGYPGNAQHGYMQRRLKGRAYRAMRRDCGIPLLVLSGIRKYESRRRRLLTSPYSKREGICFVSPLFYWENRHVIDYMQEHGIPEPPGKQYDCKCGATAADPAAEWADIEREGGGLVQVYFRAAKASRLQLEEGKLSAWWPRRSSREPV